MGLRVQLPMRIEVDNKGAVDLANSWTAINRTRHIATRINFLRELKAQGIVSVVWISNQFMSSNIFTKNVGGQSNVSSPVCSSPTVCQVNSSFVVDFNPHW
jgi:hypothetical protein